MATMQHWNIQWYKIKPNPGFKALENVEIFSISAWKMSKGLKCSSVKSQKDLQIVADVLKLSKQ